MNPYDDTTTPHLVAERDALVLRHPLPNREVSSLYLHHIRGLIRFASDLGLTWSVQPEEVTDADAELQGEAPSEDTDQDAAPSEV